VRLLNRADHGLCELPAKFKASNLRFRDEALMNRIAMPLLDIVFLPDLLPRIHYDTDRFPGIGPQYVACVRICWQSNVRFSQASALPPLRRSVINFEDPQPALLPEQPAHFFKKLKRDLPCSRHFPELHVSHLIARDRRHPSKPPVVNQIHSPLAEFDRNVPVVGSRNAAPLHICRVGDSYLEAGFRFENCGKSITNSAQLLMPESISLITLHDLSFEWISFGDYYDTETFALMTSLFDQITNLFYRQWMLWN
jgi:hypothetical protein